MKTVSLLAISLLLSINRAMASELSSTPDRTYVTNGPVQAVVRAGDTIYIGGRFDRVGPRTGPGVELALDGSQNPGLPEISGAGPSSILGTGGALNAVAPDGDGGWYIGGLFTHVGGVPRTNLARIRADRSVDPNFNPVVNDAVGTLAVSGSTVYVAGLFTSINGETRNRIAALNAADGVVKAFNPNANATVEALAISGDGSLVYAGGRFSVIGGLPRLGIAALNAADGSASLTFDPRPTQTPPQTAIVAALALSGSTLYVGGNFRAIGGQPRSNIAALNVGGPADGTAVVTFNPNASSGSGAFVCAACGNVVALAISASGSTVYASGRFTNIGGKTRNYFAELNAGDGTATTFDAQANGDPRTIVVSGPLVYVAGGFSSIGGQPRNYVAALNAIDGTATAFNPNPNGISVALALSDSSVYLAGYFSSLGGVMRRSIAALNAADGTPTSFDPSARFGANNATVYALGVSGSTVYAGGFFNSIGGQTRNYLAALNAADGTATSWNPNPSGIVETLTVSGALVYAGGFFSSIGGQLRNNIAALSVADGMATNWNPNANSGVQALLVSGPVVYAGGYFTTIGGQTRNKIAALLASDGTATPWNPDPTAQANVLALAISGSTIYAGGNFASIQGQPRKNIAGINASDGTPTSFNPNADQGVFGLAVDGSTVYAAGFFSEIGGQTRNLLAGLNAADGSATSFDPNGAPGFGAFALAVASDGTLYVGGSFNTFDLASQQGFAQFSPVPVPLSGVGSRKIHGSAGPFDVNLPLVGNPGVECRTGGANRDYTMVFKFANELASVGGVSASASSDGGGNQSVSASGSINPADRKEYIVNLSGVPNAQVLTVSLANVNDSAGNSSASVSASMGVLLGDVNQTAAVDGNDVSAVQATTRQRAVDTNFKADVNTSGTIDGNDVSIVQGKTRTRLP